MVRYGACRNSDTPGCVVSNQSPEPVDTVLNFRGVQLDRLAVCDAPTDRYKVTAPQMYVKEHLVLYCHW